MKRSARASVAFISRRSTTRSSMPCSTRNSLRWNPSGSFCLIVCSMTRGPANPMSAFGSAMFKSPSIAKLAVTPPVVGSVKDRHKRQLRSEASLCERRRHLGHLHERQRASIIRAPPELEMTITGCRRSSASSTAPGDLLANDDPHAAADERVLHRRHNDVQPIELARWRR
jgi:hypothetical protein